MEILLPGGDLGNHLFNPAYDVIEGIVRLDVVFFGAEVLGAPDIILIAEVREHEHRYHFRSRILLDMAQNLEAVKSGEHEIEHDERGRHGVEFLERLLPVDRADNLESGTFEFFREEIAEEFIVFDNEDVAIMVCGFCIFSHGVIVAWFSRSRKFAGPSCARCGEGRLAGRVGGAFARDAEGHRGALSLFGRDGDGAAVGRDDVSGDEEPQARPFGLHADDVLAAEEFGEELLPLVFGDADARVRDFHRDAIRRFGDVQ